MTDTTIPAMLDELANVLLADDALQQAKCLVVGYSGGLDSTVLLYALHQLSAQKRLTKPIYAVHVHHGLSGNADMWLQHCETQCKQLGVPFSAYHVAVSQHAGESIEAEARKQRYAELFNHCRNSRGVLLTAHHQDDQLETVLLQLKRGAGVAGLAAMAASSCRDSVQIIRPMLSMSRASLEQIANEAQLQWIDDESNQDERFDRNFLRRQIIPALQQRWPSIAKTVSRTARNCAHAHHLIQSQCEHLLTPSASKDKLSMDLVNQQVGGWQSELVRFWLAQYCGVTPSEAQLAQVLAMRNAQQDRQPEVVLGAVSVRRFDDHWYRVQYPLPVPTDVDIEPNKWNVVDWAQSSVWLGDTVSVDDNSKALALPAELISAGWQLTTMAMSTRVKFRDLAHTRTLQNWCKQWNIPPWERQLLPALLANGKLVAVLAQGHIHVSADVPQPESCGLTLAVRGNNLPHRDP